MREMMMIFELTLRGWAVDVYVTTCPPEPDVGIFTRYVDNYRIFELYSNCCLELDWDLTQNELNDLDMLVQAATEEE